MTDNTTIEISEQKITAADNPAGDSDVQQLKDGQLNRCILYSTFVFDLLLTLIIASFGRVRRYGILGMVLGSVIALIFWIFFLPVIFIIAYFCSKNWSLRLTQTAIHYHPAAIWGSTDGIPLNYIHSIYAQGSKVYVELPKDKYIAIIYPNGGVPENFGTFTTGFCCFQTRHEYDYITYKIKYVANSQEFVDAVLAQMNSMGYQVLNAQ